MRVFQDMLNEYLTYPLLRNESLKRLYFLNKAQKDEGWLGGDMIVPFQGSRSSNFRMGKLTPKERLNQSLYIRGKVDKYKKAWGSLIFNHEDLIQHDKISEQNFLKLLPDEIEAFMDYMKECVSLQLTGEKSFAKATEDGEAEGTIKVNRVDRFHINQYVNIQDSDSQVFAFVKAIDINTNIVSFVTALGGTTAADLSTIEVDKGAAFYYDGIQRGTDPDKNESFNSLRLALLSQANGGDATLYGQSKTAYPYLQATNINGSGITDQNFLQTIFKGYTQMLQKNRGMASHDVVMSLPNLGRAMSLIETQKGGFKVMPRDRKAELYFWKEIEIMSVSGQTLKLVGIQEMDDDVCIYLDTKALQFKTNGGFRKVNYGTSNNFYIERTEDGPTYICDMFLFGEFVVSKPANCGIIHSIPAPTL